ncbi:MAG: cytochrome P450 [Gammaproteobacteria bacterium]
MPPEQRPLSISRLPGPKGIPILGNLLQIDLRRLHSILEAWADNYGAVYKFRLTNKTVVAVSDPELIHTILRDRPQTYRRAGSLERVARELGTHGVFSAEGDQWLRQRHLTMQAFRQENLRRFFPSLHKITERLQNRWHKAADSGQPVDVDKDWMRFTVDVTTHFAFGYDINLLEKDSDDFQRHLERQLPGFNRRANAPFPYWHYLKLPGDHAMEKSLAAIKETINEFIVQTRRRLEQQTETVQLSNFLEALLMARDDNGAPLSDEEIQGNIITLLLAGEDTTAHTLSWLMYLIAEYPDVQRKMQQEADNVLGEETTPRELGSIDKLPYIEAVAHETLRLKSAAPLLFMEPNIDVELGEIRIPKGTFLILLSRYAALQDENFADARLFKPERWLDSNSHGCTHNRSAFIPFGAGPRFCPGRQLAMLEIKTAMAMVCRNFTVARVDTGQPVQEKFSFTMMPDKLQVKFEHR